MEVKLLAHTQLTDEYKYEMKQQFETSFVPDGQAIALTAIRTCYNHNVPSSIVELEGEKYFGKTATDGQGGTEADRLCRHIVNSGHTSTLEHLSFTFAIEGVSRSLLAQLTRHRHFSYSVQSQRYVKFGSGDKSEGFNYVTPESINKIFDSKQHVLYCDTMIEIQNAYDKLRKLGINAEDARYVLPNAATCNLVLTGNLRSILEFCSKRGEGTHAQNEIQQLAKLMKSRVVEVEPWTEQFFVK